MPLNCSEPGDVLSYDGLKRVIDVRHPDLSQISISYSNSCATITDEAGKTRESCTDAEGHITEAIENPGGLNYTTTYTYDPLGNLLGVTQAGSHSRSFIYDSLSRLTSATNPESGTTTYTYDADGNVATRTDARSIITTYTYDVNRLMQKTYSDGTIAAHYYYDVMPSWWSGIPTSNAIGMLTAEGTSADLSTWPSADWFRYDTMGRVSGEPQWPLSDGTIYWILYARDLLGNVTSLSNGLGTTFSYQRNVAGQVTSVTSSLSDPQHPASLATVDPTIGYWPTGALRLFTLANGLTEDTMYDSRWRLCRINVNTWQGYLTNCTQDSSGRTVDFTVAPAANGSITSFSAIGAQTFNRTYTYDALNRLSTMSAPGDQCTGLSWTYDAWGNRTDQTATGGTCDTFHQSVNANNQFSTGGYQYDAAGNMTYDGSHTYTYDAEKRITKVDGGSTATYVYSPDGQRVQKTVQGATVQYLYDLDGHQIAEVNSSGAWNRAEIYADNWHLGTYSGGPSGTTSFLITDHLGSTRLVTGYPTATPPIECDDYYPFGELISCGGSSTAPFKFTGYQRDPETASTPGGTNGLDNALARYYGSPLGRFMSPDPVGDSVANPANPQTWNLYSYVTNNPLSMIDPTGTDECFVQSSSDDGHAGTGPNPPTNEADCVKAKGTWVISNQTVYATGSIDYYAPAIISSEWQSVTTPKSLLPLANLKSPSSSKKACPALPHNPRADGIDTLFAGFARITHPLEVTAANLSMLFASGGQLAGGGLSIAGGCLEPTPAEPGTCAAGIVAGGILIPAGVASGAGAVYFFENVTIPAFKDWGC